MAVVLVVVAVAVALATCGVELLVVDDALDPPPHAATASEAQSASGASRHAGRPGRHGIPWRLGARSPEVARPVDIDRVS